MGGFAGPEGAVTVPIKPRFSANNGQALRQSSLAGLGIIFQVEELTRENIGGPANPPDKI